MTKKGLIITLVALVGAAAGTVVLIRYLILPASPQADLPLSTSDGVVAPPTTDIVPQSLTKGIETLTGVLSLENGAILKVDTKTYSLLINKTDAGAILKVQGYKTGDEVNVMGKASGDSIEAAGVIKLVR